MSRLAGLFGFIRDDARTLGAAYNAWRHRAAAEQVAHLLTVSPDDPRLAQFTGSSSHPIETLTSGTFGSGIRHEAQLGVFHLMRRYYPTLDAAIKNRRAIECELTVDAEQTDPGLAAEIKAFMDEVPVGYIAEGATPRGLNAYLNLMADGADEYGFTAGEVVTDEGGREILRLVVPNQQTLALADDDQDGIFELYQATKRRGRRRLDNAPLVQTLSFTHTTDGPWPPPMAWSLVKGTEIVLRMYQALLSAWWRFGDPSMLLGIEYEEGATPSTVDYPVDPTGKDGTMVSVPVDLVVLKRSVETIMRARREGRVGDAYTVAQGGKIINEVLGDQDAALTRYFREHAGIFDGHVIAQSRTPVWMYPGVQMRSEGMNSNLSDNEAQMALTDAEKRNRRKEALAREILDFFLMTRGEARYIGKYALRFTSIPLLDEKAWAEAEKVRAEAESQWIENAGFLFDEETGAPRQRGDALEYLRRHEVL